MTDLDTYRSRLLLALRLRDVPGPRIAEALAEVDSHIAETGEDPTAAFGRPADYARRLHTALDPDAPAGAVRGVLRGLTWRESGIGLLSLTGAGLLANAVGALGAGAPRVLGVPTGLVLVLGLVLLGGVAVQLAHDLRQQRDPVLDPRTGTDMAPAQPRWATAITVACPVALLVVVFVLGRASG